MVYCGCLLGTIESAKKDSHYVCHVRMLCIYVCMYVCIRVCVCDKFSIYILHMCVTLGSAGKGQVNNESSIPNFGWCFQS